MSRQHTHFIQKSLAGVLLALAPLLGWWLSHRGSQPGIDPATFVFYHTAVGVFAVVVALLIFSTGYHAILSARKGAVVLLGVSFLGVGLLDFLHTMSHVGVPDAISTNMPHRAMFFWLAARCLTALTLLVYALLPTMLEVTRLQKRLALVLMLLLLATLGGVGLLWPHTIPALLMPGQGSTALRITLEWLVVAMHLATLAALWLRRRALAQECLLALALAVALSAVSELFFTLPGTQYGDEANAIGHVYKVAAYLFLLHATFNESLRRPLERLAVQNQRENLILNAAPDGMLWVDGQGTMLMANPAMQTLTGYTAQELVGQNVDLFLPEHLRTGHAQAMRGYFLAPQARAMALLNLKLRRRDGRMLPVDISLGHWEDAGEHHAIAYIRDQSERARYEDSLKHQATHDKLTGLPNRWLFSLQLNQAVAASGRSGKWVAVLLLDLDGFKTVNDSFGHATGDALLVQAGKRMRSVLRENDTLARMGGDEFAILLTDLTSSDEAVSVVSKLLTTLSASYRLHNMEIHSSASVGLAFCPDDAKDSDTLLRYADMAMYQAKDAGRGTYSFYSNDLDWRVREDMQMHNRLKDAIAQGHLSLHYQPQVDVATGDIQGAEALMRWHDPVLGQVCPARFIPVAESTGLILALSDWVLETACTQIATWMQAGTPLRVAINVSAQQFRQFDLPEKVSNALARTGAQAQWLDIEITESAAMKQPEQAREQLDALVALGCRVALDDFGTGYSSLSYLKALPLHKLKIDKSFMDGVPHDANDVAISRAIIAMAHSLGMTLTAEGVENAAQLAFLQEHDCETYQGWLFAKAMSATALTERLCAPTRAGHCLAKKNEPAI